MPIPHDEIIEEIERHIRKFGGEVSDWYVGTAKDARAQFFRRHLAADLGDGLIYREAFTTSAADQVIDHLVNARGLRLDRDAVPEPGRIVFVYRPTVSMKAEGSTQKAETSRQWAVGSQGGIRDAGLGVRDSEEAVRDSKAVGVAHPTFRADQPGSHKLAA